MATLKVSDVMYICGCARQTVISWIKKGYLPATQPDPDKYRNAFNIEEADLKKFMASDNYYGHPEDIVRSRSFNRTPSVEQCYPINVLASVIQLDFDKEETPTDIWDYDIRQFRNLIGLLTDREQRVIQMRYQYGMTFDEIAATFDLHRERIRQIQVKAERKLHNWMCSKGCRVVTRDVYEGLQKKYASLVAQHEILRAQYDKIANSRVTSEVDLSLVSLEWMNFTVRLYNCLKRAGFNTLKDIIDFDKNQQDSAKGRNWLNIRNLGRKSLMEVAKKIFDCCGYRIQYFSDGKYQGLIPITEGESLVVGNVEYFRGEKA